VECGIGVIAIGARLALKAVAIGVAIDADILPSLLDAGGALVGARRECKHRETNR
jgi:hypothetical protein